jgi:hypothetical protein
MIPGGQYRREAPERPQMSVNLKGRSLLTLKDFTREEIVPPRALGGTEGEETFGGEGKPLLRKNICLIFDKTSTAPVAPSRWRYGIEGG